MAGIGKQLAGAYKSMRESEYQKAEEDKLLGKLGEKKLPKTVQQRQRQSRWETKESIKEVKNSFGDINFQTFYVNAETGAERDKLKRLNDVNINLAEEINKSLAEIADNTKVSTKQNTQINKSNKDQKKLNKNLETIIKNAGWGINGSSGRKGKKGKAGIAGSIEKMIHHAGQVGKDGALGGMNWISAMILKWKLVFAPLLHVGAAALKTLGKTFLFFAKTPFNIVYSGWKFVVGIGSLGKAAVGGLLGLASMLGKPGFGKALLGFVKSPLKFLGSLMTGKVSKWSALLILPAARAFANLLGVKDDQIKEVIMFFRDNVLGAAGDAWNGITQWWSTYASKVSWETFGNEAQLFFSELKKDPLKAVFGGAGKLFKVLANMTVDLLKVVKQATWNDILKPILMNALDFNFGPTGTNLAELMMGKEDFKKYSKTNFTQRHVEDMLFHDYVAAFNIDYDLWKTADLALKSHPAPDRAKRARDLKNRSKKSMRKNLNLAIKQYKKTSHGRRAGSSGTNTIKILEQILDMVENNTQALATYTGNNINYVTNEGNRMHRLAKERGNSSRLDMGTVARQLDQKAYDVALAKRKKEVDAWKEIWKKENLLISKIKALMNATAEGTITPAGEILLKNLRAEFNKRTGRTWLSQDEYKVERKAVGAFTLFGEALISTRSNSKIDNSILNTATNKYNEFKKSVDIDYASHLGKAKTAMGAITSMGVKDFDGGKGAVQIVTLNGKNGVKYPDGSVKLGGHRNWRNNNPGNLKYGSFAKSHGAVGSDGVFAIWTSLKDGYKAQADLLQSRNYKNLTLQQAIHRYAPNSENDTQAYINYLVNNTGVSPYKVMRTFSAAEMMNLVKWMSKKEGMKPGTVLNSKQAASKNLQIVSGLMGAVNQAKDYLKTGTAMASGSSMKLAVMKLFAGTGFLAATAKAFGGTWSGMSSGVSAQVGKDWGGSGSVGIARAMVGNVGYSWGGKGNDAGLDCSGFVQKVMKQAGIQDFPGGTKTQLTYLLKAVREGRADVITNISDLKGGDIIMFDGHVGIMGSNNTLIHSSGGEDCTGPAAAGKPGCRGVIEVPSGPYLSKRSPVGMFRMKGVTTRANSNTTQNSVAATMALMGSTITKPIGSMYIPELGGIIPNGSLEMQVIQNRNQVIERQLAALNSNVATVMKKTNIPQNDNLTGIIDIPQ